MLQLRVKMENILRLHKLEAEGLNLLVLLDHSILDVNMTNFNFKCDVLPFGCRFSAYSFYFENFKDLIR